MDNTPTATPKRGSRFFDENMLHPKATDRDAPKLIEFDWELLRRNLGEEHDALSGKDYAALGAALGDILRWIVKGDNLDTVGRRAVALAWVVNPDIFNGYSATTIARRFGCPKLGIHLKTSEARRSFGVRNKAQKHGWNFNPKSKHPRKSK